MRLSVPSIRHLPRSTSLIRPSALPQIRTKVTHSSTSPSTTSPLSTTKKPPLPVPTITELPNKLRVVTEPSDSHTTSVAIVIDAGSRYESPRNSGTTHLLDRIAWQSNSRYSHDEIEIAGQAIGSNMINIAGRDNFFYGATTFPSQLPLAISLLASNMLSPLFLPEEIEQAKLAALYETEVQKEQVRNMLGDLVLQTAYKGNTIGNPFSLTEEQAQKLGERELRGYMKDWFRPERMVVTGFGMEHQELVDLVKENFDMAGKAFIPPTSSLREGRMSSSNAAAGSSQTSKGKTYATVSNVSDLPLESDFEELAGAKATYTGGEVYEEVPSEQFTHLAIGFEAPNVNDPDVYPTAVMQQLLLGGSSFSQGGPGKGMFSRLNLNVLNRYYWVDQCQSFHEVFADTGLLGIRIAVQPKYASRAAAIICEQLHALTGNMMSGVKEDQLVRAKNMLKAFLAMGTESRLVAAEDIGRQILAQGYKEPLTDMWAKVDAVTIPDIHRVASRIFRPQNSSQPMNFGLGAKGPVIVGMGNGVAGLGDVRRTIKQWDLGQ